MMQLNKALTTILCLFSFTLQSATIKYSVVYDPSGCEAEAKQDMEYYVNKLKGKLAAKGIKLIESKNAECVIKLVKESKIEGVLTDIDLLMMLEEFTK